MNCPFLTGNYLKSCSASREVYVPTSFEMDEYCTGQWHSLCGLYRQKKEGEQSSHEEFIKSRYSRMPGIIR